MGMSDLRRRAQVLAVCLGLTLLSGQAWAGSGTTSAAFLLLGHGARAAAMGNAFTAVADDVSATHWNPAGLASLASQEISAERTLHIQDTSIDRLAYVHPFGLDRGGTPQAWALSTVYLQQNGIEQRSANTVEPEGTFGASDFAVGLSYARNLRSFNLPRTSLGVTARSVQQRISGYSARAMSFDAGLLSQMGPLKLGVAASNMGTAVQFLNQKYPLPAALRLGAAWDARALPVTVSLGAEKVRGESGWGYHAGTEFHLSRVLDLRAGYLGMSGQTKRAFKGSSPGTIGEGDLAGLTGMAGGLGFHISNYSLDYAFTPYGELGMAHKITLGAKF
jgi:long-subunit fatty acid transport protein